MTVFVAHAPADHETAEALEKFIERRGQFCELDDGQTAKRPVQVSDVFVLLLSKDFVFAPTRLRLEQRALDAWADGRLLVVKLDTVIAPVGLRDLPAIDASFGAQREFKWQEVADAIRKRLQARPTAPDATPALRTAVKGGNPRGIRAVAMLVLTLPGVLALAALISIWLANRIGPTPGGITELRTGVDALGARFGLGALATEAVFAVAIALMLTALVFLVAAFARRGRRSEPAAPAPASAQQEQSAASASVFVSYARANAATIAPLIDGAKQSGHAFWLDQRNIAAGDSWAGEIVRAIRGAADVVVMCSKAAFESDHVKREIYLADRYRKRLVPVFIEDAAPPEDFEYFFAGVQFLRLFETPEAERPQAFAQMLGAS